MHGLYAFHFLYTSVYASAFAVLKACRQSCQGRQSPALPAARTHARTPGLGRLVTQFLTAGGATEKQNPLSLRRMSANPPIRAGRTDDQDPENKRGHNHNSPDFTIEELAC